MNAPVPMRQAKLLIGQTFACTEEEGRSDDRRVTSASTLMFRASNYNITSLHISPRLVSWCPLILVLYLCCPVEIPKPSSHWNRLPSPKDGASSTPNSHMKAAGDPERRYTYSYTQKARDHDHDHATPRPDRSGKQRTPVPQSPWDYKSHLAVSDQHRPGLG
jgi:hypothetical protein